MKNLFILVLLVFPLKYTLGQCGTTASSNYKVPKFTGTRSSSISTRWMGIKLAKIRSNNQDIDVNAMMGPIFSSLIWINEKYSATGLHFYIYNTCESITDNDVANCTNSCATYSGYRSKISSYVSNTSTLNLIIVDTICNQGISTNIGGFAYFPGDVPVIVLERKSITNSTTTAKGILAHELGHLFGLYHTFESAAFGAEHPAPYGVSCYNADVAGDKISDTYADPGIVDKDVDKTNCTWKNFGQTKTCNQVAYKYTPSTSNIMSYSDYTCYSQFSSGQLLQIYDVSVGNVSPNRSSLIAAKSTSNLTLDFPISGDYSAYSTGYIYASRYMGNHFNVNDGRIELYSESGIELKSTGSYEVYIGCQGGNQLSTFYASVQPVTISSTVKGRSNNSLLSVINSDDNINHSLFNITPIPCEKFLNLNLTSPGKFNWVLLDVTGKLINYGKNVQDKTTIDIAMLSSGIYYIKLDISGKSETRIVIKD